MLSSILLEFYFIKRLFLFCDEWLFYSFLLILLCKKYYKVLPFVTIYGILCIYTSYYNIDKIEKNICEVDQKIFILDNCFITILNFLKQIYNFYYSGENIFSN